MNGVLSSRPQTRPKEKTASSPMTAACIFVSTWYLCVVSQLVSFPAPYLLQSEPLVHPH